MSASYALMDTNTDNLVGSFRSQAAAFRAVAETAKRYGLQSNAVLSLVLFREDGPAEEGFIAEGEELVRRALETIQPLSAARTQVPTRRKLASRAGSRHKGVAS